MKKNELKYDVAVIGGGPAGMIAAIEAARMGASVVLVEKNETLGKKLLITGGGRCNLTNATFDNKELAKKYGNKGKFLLSPLSKWSVRDSIDFFESRDMDTKTEAEDRVFPKSNSAQSVFEVLTEELRGNNVHILLDSPVTKIKADANQITTVETPNTIIIAHSFIMTTGGTARPETGSSGDGFKWLSKLGHTIRTPEVALVPIKTKEEWSHRLAGVSLKEVKVSLLSSGVRCDTRPGKILFTHVGLSGPLILNMSSTIGESLTHGPTTLEIDLFPDLDHGQLDEMLRSHLLTVQNKKWANALLGFVQPVLAGVLVDISDISETFLVNKIPRMARLSFIKKLKALPLTVTGLLGREKAISSSGGVALEEINFKTMQSSKISNLYLAGDILDFDRPSGGFSLQICWTTGALAGQSAAESLPANFTQK